MFEKLGFGGMFEKEEKGEIEEGGCRIRERGRRIRDERVRELLLVLEGIWKGEREGREEVFVLKDRAMVGGGDRREA